MSDLPIEKTRLDVLADAFSAVKTELAALEGTRMYDYVHAEAIREKVTSALNGRHQIDVRIVGPNALSFTVRVKR